MPQDILIKDAINLYAQGNLNESETLFRQILFSDPVNSQALYFLGLIAATKGIYDEASQLLYRATLIEPKNTDYLYSLATVLQESGKTKEAIEMYEKLPEMPESWNNLGNIYMADDDLKKALKCFDEALQRDPKMLWAMVNKSILLRMQNDITSAKKILHEALKIDGKFIPTLYQLSVCYRQESKFEKALQTIQNALQFNNIPDFVYVEYGKVLCLLNQKKEALAAFDKAIEINRFCQDAYFEKALILENENKSEAEKVYRDLLRINPNNIAAYNNLGSLLYRMNRTNEALEMYRQVVILNPNDMAGCFNLAVALEDLEEYAEAAGLYFNVLSHHQFEEQTHIRLSALLPKLFEQDKDLALRYAEGWVKNFPQNTWALHTSAALSEKPDDIKNDLAYAQNLYDHFAETYEDKMHELTCEVPQKIGEIIGKNHYQTALDLGCGTGLCGVVLKPLCDSLDGVDISKEMVKIAEQKNIYAHLYQSDIKTFLSDTKQKYDLIVASDVFCYINYLSEIIKEIHKVLKTGGTFIFTTEKSENKATQMTHSGRYQHAPALVESELKNAGFKTVNITETPLRKEGAGECQGNIFVVEK